MENSFLINFVVIGILVVVVVYFIQKKYLKSSPLPQNSSGSQSNTLQLQAYERLALLVDRIALPNLLSRTAAEGLSAAEMQFILTKSVRDEFDYNVTQQIYVSPEIWKAVRNLKEKNILIINQIAQQLPINSNGYDLQKGILHFMVNDPHANLYEVVGQALSFEAKKLL